LYLHHTSLIMKIVVSKIILLQILFSICLSIFAYDKPEHIIEVGIYENYPKVFVNDKGKPAGIFIDVLECICENENIEIKYTLGRWDELIHKLSVGEIDVLPDVSYSVKRDSIFVFPTLSVLGSWVEAYVIRGETLNSISDLNGKTIGVLKGSVQEQYLKNELVNKFNITYNIVVFDDYKATVNALEKKEVNVIIVTRFFYFSELCNRNIVPTGIVLRPSELYFAFKPDINPQIVKIFDKNLSVLKNNPKSEYYKSLQYWLNKQIKTGIPQYLFFLIIITLIVLAFVSVFAVILHYRVKAKTKALRKRNRQLIIAKEKAEESDKLKTVFLQNMSHEIRTPMNGILGFIELLKNPELGYERKEEYIKIINESGKRLLETLNNIIEISKIEAKQFEIRCKSENLVDILAYCVSFYKPAAKRKGLDINLNCKKPELYIDTDKKMLISIITNLINNALKFTQKGYIEIGCNENESSIDIYVKDTGIGIRKDRLKAVFNRFEQADLDITRPYEGSGLGLAIVKEYVEALKGEIKLESKENFGSTFTVSFNLN